MTRRCSCGEPLHSFAYWANEAIQEIPVKKGAKFLFVDIDDARLYYGDLPLRHDSVVKGRRYPGDHRPRGAAVALPPLAKRSSDPPSAVADLERESRLALPSDPPSALAALERRGPVEIATAPICGWCHEDPPLSEGFCLGCEYWIEECELPHLFQWLGWTLESYLAFSRYCLDRDLDPSPT